MAQMVKNLPAMWETWVLSLGWEDRLEEGMATHSSIFAWRIPWRGVWQATVHSVAKGCKDCETKHTAHRAAWKRETSLGDVGEHRVCFTHW